MNNKEKQIIVPMIAAFRSRSINCSYREHGFTAMQSLITKHRYLLFILISAFLFFFGYWLKCRIGIDFFDSFSIGSYFPFDYLKTEPILSPQKGILIHEDFDKVTLFSDWSNSLKLYPSATKELSEDGFSNTTCLLIRNSSKRGWVHSHRTKIVTKTGDKFSYEGLVNIKGNRLSTYFSIAAFDENKKIVNWNLFKGRVNRAGSWVSVKKIITISDDRIKFITFRIVGAGQGEFRFDNIIFSKLN